MAGFTNYLKAKVLNLIFGNQAYSVPATLYAALSTTTPVVAGTNFTEPSGGAYARVAITNNNTNFPDTTDGNKANGTAITFPTATALWGTVTHIGIYDASSNGNLLGFAALNSSQTIDFGDYLSVAIGDLDITLT